MVLFNEIRVKADEMNFLHKCPRCVRLGNAGSALTYMQERFNQKGCDCWTLGGHTVHEVLQRSAARIVNEVTNFSPE